MTATHFTRLCFHQKFINFNEFNEMLMKLYIFRVRSQDSVKGAQTGLIGSYIYSNIYMLQGIFNFRVIILALG